MTSNITSPSSETNETNEAHEPVERLREAAETIFNREPGAGRPPELLQIG